MIPPPPVYVFWKKRTAMRSGSIETGYSKTEWLCGYSITSREGIFKKNRGDAPRQSPVPRIRLKARGSGRAENIEISPADQYIFNQTSHPNQYQSPIVKEALHERG
jgi:hypothetical protein